MKLPKINSALQSIQKHMLKEGIKANARNKQMGYEYRSIKDIYTAFAKPLSDNNVILLPQDVKVSTKFLEDNKNSLTRITGTMRFYCTEDGSWVDRSYEGHSKSAQQKCLEAAKSFALRSCLLETFCVPFEGMTEPEEEAHIGNEEEAPAVERVFDEVNEMVQELKGAKSMEEAKGIFARHDKAAEICGDKALQVKLNVAYAKWNEDKNNAN
tara:strand:- start:8490 stop:9125 length:636 start_codon:yes stop_codon:yes gene_type:complete